MGYVVMLRDKKNGDYQAFPEEGSSYQTRQRAEDDIRHSRIGDDGSEAYKDLYIKKIKDSTTHYVQGSRQGSILPSGSGFGIASVSNAMRKQFHK